MSMTLALRLLRANALHGLLDSNSVRAPELQPIFIGQLNSDLMKGQNYDISVRVPIACAVRFY
ncbi:MAG: hypothetical protein ACI915_000003 [Gammaproteobacteria bacterium]|jgi:hypothetical protein